MNLQVSSFIFLIDVYELSASFEEIETAAAIIVPTAAIILKTDSEAIEKAAVLFIFSYVISFSYLYSVIERFLLAELYLVLASYLSTRLSSSSRLPTY